MKTNVLKASKALAESISTKLLSYKNKNNKPLFSRHEIEYGFEIKAKQKINEIWTDVVVFRYRDIKGMQRIDYEDKLLTI